MVVTRLDKKKPTTLTEWSLEAPQPIQTAQPEAFDTWAGEMSDGTTKQVTSTFWATPAPIQTPTPIETPKINPTQAGTTQVDTTQGQVKTTFWGWEMKPFWENVDITKVTKEITPTWEVTTTETPKVTETPFDINKVLSKATPFKWADWKMYQTVRNPDNTLTTIDAATWKAVTGKYADDQATRDQIKQSFLWEPKKTSNDFFSEIQGWLDVSIEDKKTVEYQKAMQRKTNLDMFSSMSSADLANAINTGKFLPWTQVYDDLKRTNPKLVSDAEALNSINSVNQKGKINPLTMQEQISAYLTKLMNPEQVQNYKDVLSQNSQVIELNKTLAQQANELSNLKDQIEYVEEDFMKDIGDKAVSKAYKAVKMSERTRELTRAYNLALNEYNTTAGQIKNISEDIKYEIEQNRQARQDQIQNFGTALDIYQTERAYQDKLNEWTSDWSKLDDTTLYNQKTGETKIVKEWTAWAGKWQKLDENTLYNDITWEFLDQRTGVVSGWTTAWTQDYSTMDFSTNPQYQATWEASFKNNNPTWITFQAASAELKKLWTDAWVNFTMWTARPTAEGGNYVKFASVQDWLDAYAIALTQRWDDIYTRLKQWVWWNDATKTAYANDLMAKAGIKQWEKFSTLDDARLESLMAAQLQRESPAFYKALTSQAVPTTDANKALYAYADTLSPTDRTKFLKEKWIEDAYIAYKGGLTGSNVDFSDIKDITDITFPEKITEFASKSFWFGNRMVDAEKSIRNMEEKYKNSWAVTEIIAPRWWLVPNFLKSSDRQQYEQARRNFINAILRQESWAVISDTEFANAAEQYFPIAWDSKEVIEQKRINRATVIENMYRNAGKDEKGRNIVDIYKALKPTAITTATEKKDLSSYFNNTSTWAGTITNTQKNIPNPNTFITY